MRIGSLNIVLFFRIIVGNARAFAAQVLASSFLVALISGSTSLMNALKNAFLVNDRSPFNYLFLEAFNELHTLSLTWQLPAWFLIAAAVYATGLHSLEELKHLSIILRGVGASKRRILAFMVARLIFLGLSGWLLGISIGLTFSQLSFRVLAYAFNGPYEVPVLMLSDLLQIALLTIASVMLGGAVYIVRILKTSPREVLE